MAASATAWRTAAADLTAFGTDADGAAHAAFLAFDGAAADAARRYWDGYVGPDGRLPAAVRACREAAERLDHGAEQIGAAKAEIIRQLVALKQQQAAAQQAYAAGHVNALAGMSTLIAGTSTTLAHVHSQLTEAVRLGSGTVVGQYPLPGQGDPPGHQPDTQKPGMLRVVVDAAARPVHDGPLDEVEASATGVVDDATGPVTGHEPSGQVSVSGHVPVGDSGPGSGSGDGLGLVAGSGVADRSGLASGSGPASDSGQVGPGPGSERVGLPGLVGGGAVGPVPETAEPVAGSTQDGPATVRQALAAPMELPDSGAPAQVRPPDPGGSPSAVVGGGAIPGGGPSLGGPGGGVPAGRVAFGPIGAVLIAPPGGSGAGVAGAGPSAPGAPGSLGGSPGSSSPGAPGLPGGQPSRMGAGAPAAVGGPQQPGVDGSSFGGPGQAADRPAAEYGQQQPAASADQGGDHRRTRAGYPSGVVVDSPGQAPPEADRADSEDRLELFMLYLFRADHERRPTKTPARQVPPPRQEFDLAAGLRFPPGDHPMAGLVSSADALAAVRAGRGPVWLPAGLSADSPQVQALTAGHDPLGGEHERDWTRRFLVREATFGPVAEYPVRAEYAWPPAEAFPEGACAPDTAEAVVLDPGTVLDRFGDPTGVVLAAAGTPFAQRSLPPEYRFHGYYRYVVCQPLPVWRMVSAAWFDQPGGGVRFRTTYPILDLIALGYLNDVTYSGSED